jgi:hypothetical protein
LEIDLPGFEIRENLGKEARGVSGQELNLGKFWGETFPDRWVDVYGYDGFCMFGDCLQTASAKGSNFDGHLRLKPSQNGLQGASFGGNHVPVERVFRFGVKELV